MLHRAYPLKKGDKVLYHAAAGGLGQILCPWANALGAEVIGTVGSKEKEEIAKKNGCHHVINYTDNNFVEEVEKIVGKNGIDVVYDGVGLKTFEGSIEVLKIRGMMVAFGNASGYVDTVYVKKHINDIAKKYIIPGETTDGAVMFVPAEAVFAEIHAYHSDLIQESMGMKVWIVSPTTLMAVLNMARTVLKDVETRQQVHIIKSELGKLGKEFERFDQRMKKLADNIRLAHENAQDVHVTSQKISRRFSQIERVELKDNPNDLLEFEDSLLEQKDDHDD